MQDKVIVFYENRIAELEREVTLLRKFTQGRGPQKLTEEQVIEILRLRRAGIPIKQVAKQFNVAPSAVSNITSGRSWAHVKMKLETGI